MKSFDLKAKKTILLVSVTILFVGSFILKFDMNNNFFENYFIGFFGSILFVIGVLVLYLFVVCFLRWGITGQAESMDEVYELPILPLLFISIAAFPFLVGWL